MMYIRWPLINKVTLKNKHYWPNKYVLIFRQDLVLLLIEKM